jgi:rhodanese-related sulfurtransferase
MKTLTPKELIYLIDTDSSSIELIDVRNTDEYDEVHLISDIKLIPLSMLPLRFQEIDASKQIIIICRSGGRSGQACIWLAQQNITSYNLIGGMIDIEKEFSSRVVRRKFDI